MEGDNERDTRNYCTTTMASKFAGLGECSRLHHVGDTAEKMYQRRIADLDNIES